MGGRSEVGLVMYPYFLHVLRPILAFIRKFLYLKTAFRTLLWDQPSCRCESASSSPQVGFKSPLYQQQLDISSCQALFQGIPCSDLTLASEFNIMLFLCFGSKSSQSLLVEPLRGNHGCDRPITRKKMSHGK